MVKKIKFSLTMLLAFIVIFSAINSDTVEARPVTKEWTNVYCGKESCGFDSCESNEMCQIRQRELFPNIFPVIHPSGEGPLKAPINSPIKIRSVAETPSISPTSEFRKDETRSFFEKTKQWLSIQSRCTPSNLCVNSCDDGIDNDGDRNFDSKTIQNFAAEGISVSRQESACDSKVQDQRTGESNCMLYFTENMNNPNFIAEGIGLCNTESTSGLKAILRPYTENCDPNFNRVSISNLEHMVDGAVLDNNELCGSYFDWCCVDLGSDVYDPSGTLGSVNNFRYLGDGLCQGWLDDEDPMQVCRGEYNANPSTNCTLDVDGGWTIWNSELYYNSLWTDSSGTPQSDCLLTEVDCDWTVWPFGAAENCESGDTAEIPEVGLVVIDWEEGSTCSYGQHTRQCSSGSYTWSEWGTCDGAVPGEYAQELSCNDGEDNDCDGLIDSYDDDCGICTVGAAITQSCGYNAIGICTIGTENADCEYNAGTGLWEFNDWHSCDAIMPTTEDCNDASLLDEDCDGTSNSGDTECGTCTEGDAITQSCGYNAIGICTIGTENADCEYSGGQWNFGDWHSCDAIMPTTEDCNDGEDNDCDGFIDSDELNNPDETNECGECISSSQDTQACGYDYNGESGGINYGIGECTEGTTYSDCEFVANLWQWSEFHNGLGISDNPTTLLVNEGCGGSYLGPEEEYCDDGLDQNCNEEADEGCYDSFRTFFVTNPLDFQNYDLAEESSIAFDSTMVNEDGTGSAIMVYRSGTINKALNFAKYVGPAAATYEMPGSGSCGYNEFGQRLGTFECSIVDGSDDTDGDENSIVIDTTGKIHVTYTHKSTGNIGIKYASSIDDGQTWTISVVDPSVMGTDYAYPEIFLVGNIPHMIYTRVSKNTPVPFGETDEVYHAWLEGTTWNKETIASAPTYYGMYPGDMYRSSVDYDSTTDTIHVIYKSHECTLPNCPRNIFYTQKVGAGTWSNPQNILTVNDEIYRTRLSIKVGGDGNLHIVHPHKDVSGDIRSLKYATSTNGGTSWTYEDLSTCAAYNPQLTITAEGLPRLTAWSWACGGDDYDQWFFYYLSESGWNSERVEEGTNTALFNGETGSITIDNTNKVHTSYLFTSNVGVDTLRYAHIL
ncbi:hypothetical protein HOA59_01455 [archaeon]|jgi:hypothetical protein|nr:hypothetical protein [archaeon]MBT6824082.1 hypothetical protein [archaeon]MBT7107073.1 hypothetical protein [archaeon]